MKKSLLLILITAILSVSMSSCNKQKEKFEHLSEEIPVTFAMVDVLDRSKLDPDRFFRLIDRKFRKSHADRVGDGMGAIFRWDNEEFTLSENEDFICSAFFDYNRNPEELTITAVGLTYSSYSKEDLEKFYSIAMSQLEPLMLDNWGFEEKNNSPSPDQKYYLRGEECISITKTDENVSFMRIYP